LIEFHDNYPTSSLEWYQDEPEIFRYIYQPGIDSLTQSQWIRLLDIGCSSGYYLSIATRQDFDAFGVEPNAQEDRYALNNGIKLIGSTIDNLPDAQDPIDIISLWDILERILQPVGYLGPPE